MSTLYSKILLAFLLTLFFQTSFSQISLTATAGTTGPTSYTTLKSAFTAINAGTHRGDINISISANTTETGTVLLNASGVGSSSYTNILVKPAPAANPVITMDAAITLDGADNVIIDGSNTSGGTTKDLTISNTTLSEPTIHFLNGACVNSIKNAVVKGVYDIGGVIVMGTSTAATGNNNNTIQNNDITKGASSPWIGISNLGSSGKPNTLNTYTGNRITEFEHFGFSDGDGFTPGYSDQTVFQGNEIFQATSPILSLAGIYVDNPSGITNMMISGNSIHDLNAAGGSFLIGIHIRGVSVTVQNNMVALSNSLNNIYGIQQSSNAGAVVKIYANSVNIYGTTSGTYLSYAFIKDYQSTGDDVRNNNFVNTRISSGVGNQVAIANTSAAGTMIPNYNNLYSSGNARNMTGRWVASYYTTLANWQAATTQDANSVSVLPVFISATDLHLIPASNSGLDNKGIFIPGVTVDIDNESRSVTPDLGADEMDDDAPVISYTIPGSTCSVADRTLTATIADATGVPTSGLLVPRIYFKKSTGSTWFSNPGILTSGSAKNGSWRFSISASTMGGLAGGDIIQYYVIAQDVLATPNLGSSPAGAVAANVNTVTTPPATPNTYVIGNILSGTYTVGTGGTYPTLTAAVNGYNYGCLTGPVNFSLISSNYSAGESFPLVINANPNASAVNTLTIKPAAGITSDIVSDTSVIVLDGAKYVTIDGSNAAGGTTKDLTLSNTRTSGGPTFWFLSGASNNTLKNTAVKGVTTLLGVIHISTAGSAPTGNNSNLIENNDITKGTTSPIAGIYNSGTPGKPNTGNIIRNNRIFDFNGYGFLDGFSGNGNSSNTLFESNEIFQTATQPTGLTGIQVESNIITNLQISKNNIHDLLSNSTSDIIYGIRIVFVGSVTISNNMIAIANNTTGVSGIMTQAGAGAVVKVIYNTVLISGTSPNGSSSAFIKTFFSNGDQVTNNILVNNRVSTGGINQYAIVHQAGVGTMVSNYNDLVSTGNAFNYIGARNLTSATLASWQNQTFQDANSISVAPVFVSATNLHLAPGSNAAIENQGTVLTGFTTDIDGDIRDATTPDMGADEMVACIPPAVTNPNSTSVCSGSSLNITLTATVPSTFSWTIGIVTGSVTGASAGSGGTISQTLTNPGNSATGSVEYIVTPTAGICTGSAFTITVVVNPRPAVTNPASSAVCTGTNPNISLSSSIPSSFAWTLGTNTGGITGASAGSGSAINQTLTNTTNTPGSIQYLVTATAGACAGSPYTITVTVNPVPTVTSLTSGMICSGSAQGYSIASSVSGSAFTWQRAAVTGISNPPGIGGTAIITETLINTTNAPVNVLYDIVAAANGCFSNPFTYAVTVNPATAITTQPVAQNSCEGSTVTFNVVASGSNLGFQWKKDAVDISGANSSIYTIPNASTSAAGNYSVMVSGDCGAVLSVSSGLSVNPKPVVSFTFSNPLCVNAPVSFTTTSTVSGGSIADSYWDFGHGLPATTTNSTITHTYPAAGFYTVRHAVNSNLNCKSDTLSQTIVLEQSTVITTQPVNQTACTGNAVSFSVAASGTGLSYQWRKNGTNIPGATSATFSIAAVAAGDVAGYDVIVSGTCGSATSAVANFTLNATQVITTQPQSQAACVGATVHLFVVAPGSGLNYAWRKNGILIPSVNDDTLTIIVTPGPPANYDVVVSSACAATSSVAVVTVLTPIGITTQPISQTVCAGTATVFSVTAAGSPPLTYQWRKNGANIAGATGSTYATGPVTSLHAGTYDVIVTGPCGSVTSSGAILTVTPDVIITAQPTNQVICTGNPVTFTVTATGSGTTYQWRKNGTNITGATSNTYTIASPVSADAGSYAVVISGVCGGQTSNTVTLTVNAPPVISTHPSNITVCSGGTATFTVSATGTGLSYQWRKAGVNISGATSTSFTINPATAASAANYDVVINSSCGAVTSNSATLAISSSVAITSQPVSQSVCIGGVSTFTVSVSGTGTITYQWRKNGSIITGANTATYQIINTLGSNSGIYDVVVINSCGSALSQPAVLVVNNCTAVPNISRDVVSAVLMPSVTQQSAIMRIVVNRHMKTEWMVTDVTGRVVMRFYRHLNAGTNDIPIQVTGLAAGTYQVSGSVNTRKLAILRLLKP